MSCIYVEISINIKPSTVLSSEIPQGPDISIPDTGLPHYTVYIQELVVVELNNRILLIFLEGRKHDAHLHKNLEQFAFYPDCQPVCI